MGIDTLIQKWEQEYKSLEEKQRKVKDFDLLNLELSICRIHLCELKEAWDIKAEDRKASNFTKWAEETAEESLHVLRNNA